MAVDAESFRLGMRRLAASVTILTTAGPDVGRAGMTATAVSSVTADPPTLMCCVNRNNATRHAIAAAGCVAVNLLSSSDHELASRFATAMPPEERFRAGSWTTLATGAPALETAAGVFDCLIGHSIEIGSHTVFFGEVQAVQVRDQHVRPLLYAHGGYGSFAGAPVALRGLMWTPDWQVDD